MTQPPARPAQETLSYSVSFCRKCRPDSARAPPTFHYKIFILKKKRKKKTKQKTLGPICLYSFFLLFFSFFSYFPALFPPRPVHRAPYPGTSHTAPSVASAAAPPHGPVISTYSVICYSTTARPTAAPSCFAWTCFFFFPRSLQT